MEISVPYISQHMKYPVDPKLNLPFKEALIKDKDACWYACARMIDTYFYGQCASFGLPELYRSESKKPGFERITEAESPDFCRNEQLIDVPYPPSQQWTLEILEGLLRKDGPVMFGWIPAASGHFCVLIGCDAGQRTIKYHDPDQGPNKIMSLVELNKSFMWGEEYSMLRKKTVIQNAKVRPVRDTIQLSPKGARA